ncbi:MAG: D-hexose-6-phosphate mutarotase [Gammaproteobacteria bacterium]|nr:D-hexose-6-phosphate mutarotase [Gammaproteobacteria bacterium]MDH5591735.1 D-hexose-6-phosphate mutarotase [Gammaproteobacteria bacterium]
MNNAEKLNEQFGIKDQLQFVSGDGGLITVDIVNQHASARISTHGGQVLSYRPHGESEDLFFLSEKSAYQLGKAIRGGIPICWPWFGDDTTGYGRPPHGFARNQPWRMIDSMVNPDGSTTVKLSFTDTDDSKAIWPFEFHLEIEVTVGQSLEIKLTTKNIGSKAFTISQALHSYINISDINKVRVHGLDDIYYLDKTDGFDSKQQTGDVVVSQEIDRIYQNVPANIALIDEGLNRTVSIAASGSKTAVIWNPWATAIEQLTDLEPQNYQRFLCVETANAADDVIAVDPGSEHSLIASYEIQTN